MTVALLIFLFPLAWSPGPGNMTFAAAAARLGLGAMLPALAGYHIATLVVTWGIASGTALLVQGTAARVMQLAGAAYVLWLAWQMWHAAGAGRAEPRAMGFAGGAALLILNPKAYVIIALMVAQFGPLIPPVRLSVIFTLNNLLAFGGWMLAGQLLMRVFASPGAARAMNRGLAAILAAVAIWMATGA